MYNYIINATQHTETAEQRAEGVVVFGKHGSWDLDDLKAALTVVGLPTADVLDEKVDLLTRMLENEWDVANTWHTHAFCNYNSEEDIPYITTITKSVMLGGYFPLVIKLTEALKNKGWKVVFSHTERQSVESVNDAGEVVKTAVFKHVGFVEA